MFDQRQEAISDAERRELINEAIQRFESAYQRSGRITRYSFVQVLMAFDQYRVSRAAYNAMADRAEALVTPHRVEIFGWLADNAPANIKALYAVALNGWDEPLLTFKRPAHSTESYPIKKWLAAARKYDAQTKRIEKLLKGITNEAA